jgi:ribosomal protein S4E
MKVGDTVEIVGARKEAGKVGKIVSIFKAKGGPYFVVFFEDRESNDFTKTELRIV